MESEDEKWARLNKRIERARARHELTRLVISSIVLLLTLKQVQYRQAVYYRILIFWFIMKI